MNKYIKGLPYTGSKYKLLDQLLPLFPKDINCFYEPFTGGHNIAQNIKAKRYLLNEKIEMVRFIYYLLQQRSIKSFIESVKHNIDKYQLNKTNKSQYYYLRSNFNYILKKWYTPIEEHNYYTLPNSRLEILIIYFFLLVCHSFNNQIRFNKDNEFNLPFGYRTFNNKIEENLLQFGTWINNNKHSITYYAQDFDLFIYLLVSQPINSNDFIYLDPPYYNTTATYNENNWTEEHERVLFNWLQYFIDNNIQFGLSNCFINDKPTSYIMEEFIVNNKDKIKIHYLNKNYKNCNHQKKQDKIVTEIYITNVGV